MAVPAAGDVIQLRLVFPRAVRGPCTVSLRRWSSGESVWARSGLGQTPFNGRSGVVALLTGDVLTAGSYEILVTEATGAGAMADVAAYELTIGPVPAGEAKRP
jgi:hypothetical protein